MNLDIKINFKGTALGFVFVKKKMQSFIVQEACRWKGSGLCVFGGKKGVLNEYLQCISKIRSMKMSPISCNMFKYQYLSPFLVGLFFGQILIFKTRHAYPMTS